MKKNALLCAEIPRTSLLHKLIVKYYTNFQELLSHKGSQYLNKTNNLAFQSNITMYIKKIVNNARNKISLTKI